MPTHISAGPPAQSRRRMFTTVRCQACGVTALASIETELPRDQLDLAAMADASTRVRGATCPECGGALEPEVARACYWPDEPDLPALGWEASVTDGEAGEQSWFLFDHAPPIDGEDALRTAQAILTFASRNELEEVSEQVLVLEWGRPLSMRALIRLLVVEAIERQESGEAHHVAPGLSVAVLVGEAARRRNLHASSPRWCRSPTRSR
ncbi:MAG: hypothetical protein H0T97_13090 [Actinobacteria bacterium]|nr:hypothetical protein [Actinomycetota bacterium]